MTNSTRSVVEDFFGRLGAGEADRALELLAEPLDWFTPGDTALIPWMGRRTTRGEVADFFKQAGENLTPEEFAVERILAEDGTAVALGRFRYRVNATGKAFTSEFAVELHVSDGLITRYRMHEDSYAISLAFL
ncbi:nuclear transport factor 2 family protein [Streptomyces xanthophaeus]|uniref:nuclear transport factor 2 family protein n=1 Tax=Streptomyces xanthophaeus TaxID=67385 RepID=UPI0026492DA7|nr:nuclear transport factor 2 family protein [Streptomyces xanthophaeus]WKD30523.1 nuclear transport factor 2 family protein [Streptomyces xanthophaeus]